MLTTDDIKHFLESKDYNLQTKEHNQKRWMDQKLTADILSIIADCIHIYCKQRNKKVFKVKDIWSFQYAMENIVEIFKKPNLDNEKAKSEYDKVFLQPMELLAFAGVLEKRKVGRCNEYKLLDEDVLEYIAIREIQALRFLNLYIEKVLRDNNMWLKFSNFLENRNKTQEEYKKLKKDFEYFQKSKTNIKANSPDECNRIFAKVLNTLAFFRKTQGSKGGFLSKSIILKEELVYNRENFRDKNSKKPKDLTRQEYQEFLERTESIRSKYNVIKAKRFLKIHNEQYRNNESEHYDEFSKGEATQIHHIFPESRYPEICYYLENLIALTPTQHMTKAHPNNNTREICETYQHLLLLSKTERIKENLLNSDIEKIYEFSKLLFVLNVGFENDDILEIEDMNFEKVINAINLHYAA